MTPGLLALHPEQTKKWRQRGEGLRGAERLVAGAPLGRRAGRRMVLLGAMQWVRAARRAAVVVSDAIARGAIGQRVARLAAGAGSWGR